MSLLIIALWIIAAYGAFSALVVIGGIGKKREPITPGTAIAVLIIWTVIITVIVLAALALA